MRPPMQPHERFRHCQAYRGTAVVERLLGGAGDELDVRGTVAAMERHRRRIEQRGVGRLARTVVDQDEPLRGVHEQQPADEEPVLDFERNGDGLLAAADLLQDAPDLDPGAD